MNSLDPFEHHLATALCADADLNVGGFEPAQIARAAIAGGRRRPVRLAFPPSSRTRLTRFAVAAAIGVIAIGGSLYLFQRGQPSVGTPSSSPTLQSSPTPAPQSSQAAQMTVPAGATTTLLADGRVLIAGGYVYEDVLVDGSIGKYTFFDSAGLYDPTTRTFTPTGSMMTARARHTATLLSDGRVLVAGGADGGSSAELYDPATGTFSPTGPMAAAHGGGLAVRLLDGRVLVTGGGNGASGPNGSSELYDPSNGTFSPVPPTPLDVLGRETATLLADGRVLFAGGLVEAVGPPGVCRASARIFDPETDTFSPTGSMTTPRGDCGWGGSTATLLRDGRVLMTAGVMLLPSIPEAEIFDPTTGTFSPTGSPTHLGGGQTATLLAGGRVLVAGGNDDVNNAARATAELYDPVTGIFIPTGSMAVARSGHTATLLSDGRVLVTGGFGLPNTSSGSPNLTSAEIYDPVTGTFSPAG